MDESEENAPAEWKEVDLSTKPVRESSLSASAVTEIIDQIEADKRDGLMEKLKQIVGHSDIPDSGSGSVNIQLFGLSEEVMTGFKNIILPLVLSQTMLTMKIYAREAGPSGGSNDLIVKALKVTSEEVDIATNAKKANAVNVAFEDDLVIRILCFYEKIRGNLEKEKSLADVRTLISTRRSKVDQSLMRQLKMKYKNEIPSRAEAEEFFKDGSAAFGSTKYCFDLTNTAGLQQTKKKWWAFGAEPAAAAASNSNTDTPGGAVSASTHAKLESANIRLKSQNEILESNVKDLKNEFEKFKEESAKTAKALSVQHHNAVHVLNRQLREAKEAHANEVKSLTEKLQRWAQSADEEAAISAQLKTDMKNARREVDSLQSKCQMLSEELDGKDEACAQAVDDAQIMSKIANKRSLASLREMKQQLGKLVHKHTELIEKQDSLEDVIVSANAIRSSKTGAIVKLIPMPDLAEFPHIKKKCEAVIVMSKADAKKDAKKDAAKEEAPSPSRERTGTTVQYAVEVVIGAAADLFDKAEEEKQPMPSYYLVKGTLIERFGEETFKEHKPAIQQFLQERAGAPDAPAPAEEDDAAADAESAAKPAELMKRVFSSGADALKKSANAFKRFGGFVAELNAVTAPAPTPPRASLQRPPEPVRRVMKPGDAVVIQGLKGKAHFNGKHAVIKRKFQGGKFFEVTMSNPKKSIRVFPSNLKLLVTEPEPTAPTPPTTNDTTASETTVTAVTKPPPDARANKKAPTTNKTNPGAAAAVARGVARGTVSVEVSDDDDDDEEEEEEEDSIDDLL